MPYRTRIKPSYVMLRSLYLGAEAMRDPGIVPGTVTALIADDDDFAVEGTLNAQGYLSGMAKLYHRLNLRSGMELEFEVNEEGSLIITPPPVPLGGAGGVAVGQGPIPVAETVFSRMNLRRIHIEPFRAENLDNWEPENETDVYLAFGVLQEFTDFQYCCAASQALLDRLGANYDGAAKPDAILIDRSTDEYLMAEWKKHSSDYKTNHRPGDVDVLVCWHDNERNRDVLPTRVLPLHRVAKDAAITKLGEE